MLEKSAVEVEGLKGKPFPCPVWGMALPVGISQKQKPYCVCNLCGIQLFFQGKPGIKRLLLLLEKKEPISDEIPSANLAVSLYNRLEQLRERKKELEQKQGIIIRDRDLDNAITALDTEIEWIQLDLEKAKDKAEKKK